MRQTTILIIFLVLVGCHREEAVVELALAGAQQLARPSAGAQQLARLSDAVNQLRLPIAVFYTEHHLRHLNPPRPSSNPRSVGLRGYMRLILFGICDLCS